MSSEQHYLIFDLDGVITTEHIYWECARLTVWELMQVNAQLVRPYVPAVHDGELRNDIIPEMIVYAIKDRAINSNWDLTFIVACSLLAALPKNSALNVESVSQLLAALQDVGPVVTAWNEPVQRLLEDAEQRHGVELLAFAGRQAACNLGADGKLFEPEGAFWQYLYTRFQAWYGGTAMAAWGAPRLPERPVLPVQKMQDILFGLRDAGYVMCAATGRPREEAAYALASFGVADVFVPERVATYDDVFAAQKATAQTGLGKPHPYVIYKAMWPDEDVATLLSGPVNGAVTATMIGDSTSDARAAQAAGIECVGVLSGVASAEAKQRRKDALLDAGCVAVLEDISALAEWLAVQN